MKDLVWGQLNLVCVQKDGIEGMHVEVDIQIQCSERRHVRFMVATMVLLHAADECR